MRKIVLFLIASVMMMFTLAGCDSSDYKKAVSLYDSGKYAEAIDVFASLGAYKDSARRIFECQYALANDMVKDGNYEEALPVLRQLGDYQDAASLRRSASYAVARAYIKENGTTNYHSMSDDVPTDLTTFPYAITQKDDDGYYLYAAVNNNDKIALGYNYDIRKADTGWNIAMMGTFWVTLPETGSLAETNFWDGSVTTFAGKTVMHLDYGQSSFDITKYTETMSMQMPIKQWMRDSNNEETTVEKKLSDVKNSDGMARMSKAPVSAEPLFAESGVTLGDLGFTMLDTEPVTITPGEGKAEGGEDGSAGQTSTDSESTDAVMESTATSGTVMDGTIDITSEDGTVELKYTGLTFPTEEMKEASTEDLSNVVFVNMDYTNHGEDGYTGFNAIYNNLSMKVFQNGVELDFINGTVAYDVYKPFDNLYKEILSGTTIPIASYYVLEDKSPITIIVTDRNNNNKQSMTVELE